MTVADFLPQALSVLTDSDSARLDAELILMSTLGLSRAGLMARGDLALSPNQLSAARALLDRRRQGEPMAYILATREFWSLQLQVNPAVLIPRPETELLVEQTLARVSPQAHVRIADLGTGSGAIALAIAKARPRAQLVATDASPAALTLAAENAKALDLRNIQFVHGDWCAALNGAFDLIVSNPPYIAADDPHLRAGDVRFEPHMALVAGADGLDAIRAIAACAPAHLRTGGALLLEHGHTQRDAVTSILRAAGYGEIKHYDDLGGRPRAVAARNQEGV